MCGIAGIFSAGAAGTIEAATKSLQHRGPEGSSFYQDPELPLSLGHQRLCIIDLSEAAAQPLRYQNRYVIVHNGELYNYKEIKGQLEAKSYHFNTQSDTEVIVAAFACWGKNCLQHFDGAFAFAIWDEEAKTLFAARDRLGEKPFFFAHTGNELRFASEIKALWQMGLERQVNKGMLYNYLTLGYTTNPYDAQETFYQHIFKLPAASCLMLDARSNDLSIEQYWTVFTDEKNTSDKEAVDTFKNLLHTSVQRRLRSDVPVGTSLSGGLDSSAIAALCAASSERSFSHHCFTASFENWSKDETAQAAAIAAKMGLQHHVVPVSVGDLLKQMDALSLYQEEPVQSASVLAQYQVYAAAKHAGITVLLDGQGADEILAGYHKYYHWYWQQLYANKQLTSSGELESARALGVLEPFGLTNKVAALLPHFTASLWQKQRAKKAAAQRGLHPDFVAANKAHFAYALPAKLDLNGVLHYNTFTNGLEELLRYADRNSMAHAVEVRLPFVQHELIEFLFSLPAHFKIRNGWTKWLLRESMKKVLPNEVVWRRDKVGFEPPQQQWMQDARVQKRILQAKELLVAQQVLHPSVLQQPIKATAAHAANNLDWRYWSASYLWEG
ncbi:asparagine synthase (glutamine-hydrolyzing) [Paracnuella aquatica]|uniref:asparagine synthase (glutamine-hydrolyzing) n=1 Tax=Paracnuella aquatica TaxID=2268757 RepID=UPI000DEF3B78|nr:asparagine synthase (glutamine-hydrolyzing) [Paracnuella aquatica]RPD45999.1 asparagine synthase (glutamine-hydrolyzing) [Paracnuella aquatica]